MSHQDTPPRRRRNLKPWERRRRRALLAVLFLFAIPTLTFTAIHGMSRRNLEAQLNAIRAQGHPATWEELAQWAPDDALTPPAPPGARTAVDIYQQVFPLLTPQLYALTDITKALATHDPGEAYTAEEWVQIRDFAAGIQECLPMLYEAAALPPGKFPVDYSKGFGVELHHLTPLRNTARALHIAALAAAYDGDHEGVFTALMAGIALPRALLQEYFSISQLVHGGCVRIMVEVMSDTISAGALSAAQLQQLQDAFSAANAPNSLRNALIATRVFTISELQNPAFIIGKTPLDDLIPGASKVLGRGVMAVGLGDRTLNQCFEAFEEMIRASTLPYPEAIRIFRSICTQPQRRSRLFNLFYAIIPQFSQFPVIAANTTAALRQAETAAAIARYQLDHGGPPDDLNQLVPAYIPSVPEDPCDLQPMRYRREGDTYILYSIGFNRRDDGGTKVRTLMEGDIVFTPRPIVRE